jgi:hypothetical protein
MSLGSGNPALPARDFLHHRPTSLGNPIRPAITAVVVSHEGGRLAFPRLPPGADSKRRCPDTPVEVEVGTSPPIAGAGRVVHRFPLETVYCYMNPGKIPRNWHKSER